MKPESGFSLIELLVVLAIVAFLAFVTVPLASGWIRNAQLERDFAGIQRALGLAKALAMRNSTGAAVNTLPAAATATAAICRRNQDIFIYQIVPAGANPQQNADCTRAGGNPVYHMGDNVAITYNNQAICGAQFDGRGRLRLCQGAACNNCTLAFNPDVGLVVDVTGADNTGATNADEKNDQSRFIRAF